MSDLPKMVPPAIKRAEILWDELQHNELGGYSGINRPFWIGEQLKTAFRDGAHAERERILALLRESEETAARAFAAAHYVDRFCKGEEDPHIIANIEGNWRIFLTNARTVLSAIVAKIGGTP
jgi:hypothetical protein